MKDLLNLDRKNIWHPFSPLSGSDDPILVKSANGVYLHTQDGKKIIDAISSWWVNIHGHANEKIAEAVSKQALTLEHVIFAGFTHQPAIQLSENLLRILPNNIGKIFFSDDGSTAVEVALKMAIQYWFNSGVEKRQIIAFAGAYHGDTFGSMSVGERSIFTDPFANHLFQTVHLDFPTGTNHAEIISRFQDEILQGTVAAFIFEPLVQGAAGMRMYDAALLDELIRFAQNHNVLCIADEVFTGFGRTGKLFASDYLNNKPDIIALSKGITGGTLPLGVTACSGKIVSAFESTEINKTFFHGHSFTANPLACASANASFEILMTDECHNNIQMIAKCHTKFIDSIKHHKNVKHARCLGTIAAIELETTEATSYTNTIRKKVYQYFLEKGILLRPLGNVIYIVPPYVITENELDYIYRTIISFLDEIN
jgi:adenosylmethionine---8-amino-7-oxononanoate aminotransferase